MWIRVCVQSFGCSRACDVPCAEVTEKAKEASDPRKAVAWVRREAAEKEAEATEAREEAVIARRVADEAGRTAKEKAATQPLLSSPPSLATVTTPTYPVTAPVPPPSATSTATPAATVPVTSSEALFGVDTRFDTFAGTATRPKPVSTIAGSQMMYDRFVPPAAFQPPRPVTMTMDVDQTPPPVRTGLFGLPGTH